MNTAEILDLKATALTGAVKLTWEVSSTAYLQSFVVVVTKNGVVLRRQTVEAGKREATVAALEGTGYEFNVEAVVAQGGRVVASNPLPVAPPPPSTLQVGLIGLCGRWENASLTQQRDMEAATGIHRDRIDFRCGTEQGATLKGRRLPMHRERPGPRRGARPVYRAPSGTIHLRYRFGSMVLTAAEAFDQEVAMLERYAATGAEILPIFDPLGIKDLPLATVTEWVQRLAAVCVKLSIPNIEAGNEPYYEGMRPVEYAPILKTIEEAAGETGVIAKAWGDYNDGTEAAPVWSQCAGLRGWCVDLVQALGYIPKQWAMHLYGPQTADGVLGGGAQAGWGSLKTMEAYLAEHGLLRPLHITETGQQSPGEATDAEQAANLKTRIEEASSKPNVVSLYIFCSLDGAGGNWGIYTSAFAPKPAVAAVAEAVKALA